MRSRINVYQVQLRMPVYIKAIVCSKSIVCTMVLRRMYIIVYSMYLHVTCIMFLNVQPLDLLVWYVSELQGPFLEWIDTEDIARVNHELVHQHFNIVIHGHHLAPQ